MKKIVSYKFPIDDKPHEISYGRIIHVRGLFEDEESHQSSHVEIFVEENTDGYPGTQCIILRKTGDEYNWSGIAVCTFEIEYVNRYVRNRELMHVVRYG